jgi:enolase
MEHKHAQLFQAAHLPVLLKRQSRDGGKRYLGKEVLKRRSHLLMMRIAPEIIGFDSQDQRLIDAAMIRT